MAHPSEQLQQRQHLIELRSIHQRNFQSLEKQAASFGIEPPLKLLNSLEYERGEIARIEGELRRLGELLPLTYDTALPETCRNKRKPGYILREVFGIPQRFWIIGGIVAVLLFGTIAVVLLRPSAPNPTVVEEIPSVGTRSFSVQLTANGIAPAAIHVAAGELVAAEIINTTSQSRRVVLVSGTLEAATTAFTGGPALSLTPLLAPGERTSIVFVLPENAHYTLASARDNTTMPDLWSTIDSSNPTP